MTDLEDMSFPAVRPRKHQDIVASQQLSPNCRPSGAATSSFGCSRGGPLSTFDILAPEDKEEVLNVVLSPIDEAFEGSATAPSAGAA